MNRGTVKTNYQFTKLFLAFVFTVFNLQAVTSFAGSITDDPSEAGSTRGLCDKRFELRTTLDMNWCTSAKAAEIKAGCFVVVHKTALTGKQCSWQGCGQLSLIGRPASIASGSYINEYGVLSTFPAGTTFERVSNGFLPKRPHSRHYLKAGDALTARRACPGNPLNLPSDVRDVICGAQAAALDLNMYWSCLNSYP